MREFGVVKWYYDKAKDGKYGFLINPKYNSLFFHKSALAFGLSEENLTENKVVSFIAIPSKKHDEKWEATEVSIIDLKTDTDDLGKLYFNSFLDSHLLDNFAQFVKGLYIQTKEILASNQNNETIQVYFDYFQNAVEKFLNQEKESTKYRIARILDIGNSLFPEFNSEIFKVFSSKVSNEDHFYLWHMEHTRVLPVSYLLETKVLLDVRKFTPIANRIDKSEMVNLTILQLEELLEGDQTKSYPSIKIVLEHAMRFPHEILDSIYEGIGFKISPETEFRLWKDHVIKECSAAVILKFWKPSDIKLTEELLKNSDETKRKELALLFHKSIISLYSADNQQFKLILSFYSQVKTLLSSIYQIELLRSVINVFNGMDRIQLWLQYFDNEIPIVSILEEIDQMDISLADQILSKTRPQEATKIIEGLVFGHWETISTAHAMRILESGKRAIINEGDDFPKEIIDQVYLLSTSPIRIQLWLLEFHDVLDFENYKPYIITLPIVQQNEYIKKVLNYIHTEKVSLTVDELTSINIIDYTTAKMAESIDGKCLDYSISIILHLIKSLYEQELMNSEYEFKKKLFEIILNQIKDPKDILEIRGYFDKCGGRATLQKSNIKNGEGKYEIEYTIKRDEKNVPSHHVVCDGRKARDKQSKKPSLDSDSGMEFWWCANQMCYEPCRNLKSPTNWRNYAIQDFLEILNIKYNETDLEVYLSFINKVNRFLKHLKCRSCKHILYPTGQSNYAFDGVNKFSCRNESCEEKGKEIYLTHCLNGRCSNTVDSRDSVKCNPEGFDQEGCGWYVCKDCHACCSTEKLNGRRYVAEVINKLEYKCQTQGHRNLGIICCNECGNAMNTFEPKIEEFKRILDWFVKNKESSNQIVKYGKNKFGKWWFRLRAKDGNLDAFIEKIQLYRRIGFNVPELEEGKEFQLVSEPINFSDKKINELECNQCGNKIDLNEFPEKRYVMKGYHEKVIF